MAQEYGKILTIQEANEKFGQVLSAYKLPIITFTELLEKTSENIMFQIINNDLIILDDDRVSIYPVDSIVEEQAVFIMYSKSIVESLLSQGSELEITVEQRSEVLSITYGDKTLEYGVPCPPYCT